MIKNQDNFNKFDDMFSYANSIGFKNISSAMGFYGNNEFLVLYKKSKDPNYIKNQQKEKRIELKNMLDNLLIRNNI